MRNFAGIAVLMLATVGHTADAQLRWREYAYPDQQFAATFPGPPEVVRIPAEHSVTEVVYHVEQGSQQFQVTVFDLLRSGINEATAIAGATASMRGKGEVKLDIQAEVQGHWGHFLSLEMTDGRRVMAGVFFRNERLYEIQASAPASEFETVSSDLVRFQQSLRFTGPLRSRRFGPSAANGALDNIGGRLFGSSSGGQR